MEQEKVVITGGTGLVGLSLTKHLVKKGYKVVHLSRTRNSKGKVKVYLWDYTKGYIEKNALDNCSHLIHLAGAGLADERWNFKRKKVLIESRVDSSAFLCKYVREHNIPLKTYITSSGINLYDNTTDRIHDEDSPATEEFLSKLVVHWEKASLALNDYCKVAQVRTSAVLEKNGGALGKIAGVVKVHFGAPLGSGKQWMPWIHHHDLSRFYAHIMENELVGPYNALASEHITNAEFTRLLAKVLGKKMFLPKISASVLQASYGEMSDVILKGVRASNEKIKSTGFKFEFDEVETAFREIYRK
ncbi:MAG: TIGR01777 family oxidoreductase [Flavobacteriales bacterium]|nr:TIGR01777 family oxidoreductase [Flavobacteriales bacterium]